jgi:hypothetical protein
VSTRRAIYCFCPLGNIDETLAYIKTLKRRTADTKILVFLVPARRKAEIQTILTPYDLKRDGVSIRICIWEELAELLTASFASTEIIREFSGEILRRCKVQSPLTESDLSMATDVLARWLSQRELLKAIQESLKTEPMFKGTTLILEAKPEWDEEHCYMGVTAETSEWLFWIGFWNLIQRKDRTATPLIGHVYESKEAKKRFPKFWSSLQRLRDANLVAPLVPGHGWPIPIPISVIQGKSVREQAENVVTYFAGVLNGNFSPNPPLLRGR